MDLLGSLLSFQGNDSWAPFFFCFSCFLCCRRCSFLERPFHQGGNSHLCYRRVEVFLSSALPVLHRLPAFLPRGEAPTMGAVPCRQPGSSGSWNQGCLGGLVRPQVWAWPSAEDLNFRFVLILEKMGAEREAWVRGWWTGTLASCIFFSWTLQIWIPRTLTYGIYSYRLCYCHTKTMRWDSLRPEKLAGSWRDFAGSKGRCCLPMQDLLPVPSTSLGVITSSLRGRGGWSLSLGQWGTITVSAVKNRLP